MRISSIKCVRPCIPSNATTQQLDHPSPIAFTARVPSNKNMNYLALQMDNLPSTEPAKIGRRWRDYQGAKDWIGLLDPLDDNLRDEIIRYGRFVEATYDSCNFDISSPLYATCRHAKRNLLPESGFRASGYRVCKYLHANSGIRLPRWVPARIAMQSSWIGYVAVCESKKEIARLGRRDVVIALRGTVTCLEWLENLRATLTPVSDSEPMVESGFLSLYTSTYRSRPSLQDSIKQEISRILDRYGDEPLSFTITGHSLGAALATLAAYDIKRTFEHSPPVTVMSFAGPRVGNWSFRCELERQGTKILRIVNSDDLITKVPGFLVEHDDPSDEGIGGWVQNMIGLYADVGCELRLSSRHSPYLSGINVATCHDLKTYLHLVDGFVSSNCPFRATARKIINKKLGTG